MAICTKSNVYEKIGYNKIRIIKIGENKMKAIVYQGSEEKFRCRTVEDDGTFVNQTELFETQKEAIDYATNTGLEYEVRPTVQEVAEGEA